MMPIALSPRGRTVIAVAALAALFFALRLPGIHLPYHQDEWKNVAAAASAAKAGSFFAHPPLMQMAFVAARGAFGEQGMRFMPLAFAALSVPLLYAVVRRRADAAAAIWSAILYSVSFYSVWGSLQMDVDGSLLPFLFLLSVWAYDRGKLWLLVASLLAGMLVKLSFVIAVGAIAIDYLCANRRRGLGRATALVAAGVAALALMFIALLYLIQAAYPAFSISFMLAHANQFSSAGGRGWMQIAVQALKAVYYLSPLLVAPLVSITRDVASKTRIFILYLVFGILFYVVIFDFSQGALDKYLAFAIVPLAAIGGAAMRKIYDGIHGKAWPPTWSALTGAAIALAILSVNFLPQIVVGLYPKTAWFSSIARGHWNILTPFTGGSGPMGFYVTFSFIALSFLACIAFAALARAKKGLAVPAVTIMLMVGFSYNLVFAEELQYGKINGSSSAVLGELSAYIASDPDIKEVLSYNDIGSGQIGNKYAGRFYAAPQFEEGHRDKFAKFSGYYMIVDIPHLYENGFYAQFFSRCRIARAVSAGRIGGYIYDCRGVRP